MELVQLVYLSSAKRLMSDEDLLRILDQSRRNNAERGITGMLLYADGCFIQVLEGPADKVDAIYETISADPRHGGLIRLLRKPAETRVFGDWTMGFVRASYAEIAALPGVNDALTTGRCIEELAPGAIRRLVDRFVHDNVW